MTGICDLVEKHELLNAVNNYYNVAGNDRKKYNSLLSKEICKINVEFRKTKTIGIMTSRIQTGGYSTSLKNLEQTYKALGYRVYILSQGIDDEYLVYDNSNIIFYNHGKNAAKTFIDLVTSYKIDTIIQISVAHQFSLLFVYLCKILNIRFIATLRTSFLMPLYDRPNKWLLEYRYYKHLDMLLVMSLLDKFYFSLLGIKSQVFVNGIFHMEEIKKISKSSPKKGLKLLWIGRLDNIKNPFSLVPIMKEITNILPDASLCIIGEEYKFNGESFFNIKDFLKTIKENGLNKNIELVGQKSHTEIKGYLNDADILVSTSRIESFQNTLIEGMIFGLPIVMFKIPHIWAVQNNIGISQIPQNNYKKFAKEVIKIYKSQTGYQKMSSANLKKVSKLKVLNFDRFWREIINGRTTKTFEKEFEKDNAGLMKMLVESINAAEKFRTSQLQLKNI